MTEKQTKTLTVLGKITGVVTTLSSYNEMIPHKFMWVGVIIAIVSSALKDVMGFLGDWWDDGVINKSYQVPISAEKNADKPSA